MCERQALHCVEEGDEISIESPRLAACELSDVGILFLRHETRTCRVPVAQFDKPELCRCPENDVLAQSGKMHPEDRECRKELAAKIAIRDGIHAILRHGGETELSGHRLAI